MVNPTRSLCYTAGVMAMAVVVGGCPLNHPERALEDKPSISTQVTDGTFVDTASFPVIEPAGNDAFTTGPQISKRDDVELDPPQQVQVPAEVALQSRDVCTTASQPAKLKKKFWSTKKNPSFAANLARGQ